MLQKFLRAIGCLISLALWHFQRVPALACAMGNCEMICGDPSVDTSDLVLEKIKGGMKQGESRVVRRERPVTHMTTEDIACVPRARVRRALRVSLVCGSRVASVARARAEHTSRARGARAASRRSAALA